MKTDRRIDTYILKSEKFAEPILIHLRTLIHHACPDAAETMKWSFPHFMYKDEILCSMAAFTKHCAFGFWKGSLIPELSKKINKNGETAMGQFGRLTSLEDLPSDRVFISYVKKAMKLHDAGVKLPQRTKSDKPKELIVPDYFMKALQKNKTALKTFNTFPFSHKKEYVQWITEAKTDATRDKRMSTAVDWIAEGKDRNWKYRK